MTLSRNILLPVRSERAEYSTWTVPVSDKMADDIAHAGLVARPLQLIRPNKWMKIIEKEWIIREWKSKKRENRREEIRFYVDGGISIARRSVEDRHEKFAEFFCFVQKHLVSCEVVYTH